MKIIKNLIGPCVSVKKLTPVMLAAASILVMPYVMAQNNAVEEVFVEAEFYSQTVLDTASSISVIDSASLYARNAVHLEDVLNVIPNVNFSSGASRGRFFQIRGIGERSQFVDPVNPSVGLIIDGIDFTGIGGAATTLDVKQLEVLRGPQGTLYGANALAGLINIVSKDPSLAEQGEGKLRVNLGNYSTKEFSQVLSGKVADDVAMRFAMSKNVSDGFIRNTHLDRNTNNINETTLRTKILWQASEKSLLKFTGYLVDANNGYDAFTLDNSRETLSDEPGQDDLLTRAGAIQYDYSGFSGAYWENTLSFANSDSEYGFDEDWTYRTICAIDSDCAYWQYSTKDNYARDKQNISLDSRLVSNNESGDSRFNWVLGMYYRAQEEELLRTYTNNDPDYSTFYGPITQQEISLFSSDYKTENAALYSQLGFLLTDAWKINAGLRLESREADYSDSNSEQISKNETLWGGKLSLEYRGANGHLFYGLISRGYKAGGNNVPGPLNTQGEDLIPVIFDTEFMWNYEIGHKAAWGDGSLESQLSVFYQDRQDMQVRQSLVVSRDTGEIYGDCPCRFVDYLGNAAAGINHGIELEINKSFSSGHLAWLSVGLLETEYQDFDSYSHVEANPETGTAKKLDGRQQAHAPAYQFAAGFQFQVNDAIAWRFETEAKDEFYLSPRHEEKTKAYTLFSTRLTYRSANEWEFALWGKNLSDEETIVRGFGSFGNDPRKFYVTEPYYQFGAPRTFGISASLHLR